MWFQAFIGWGVVASAAAIFNIAGLGLALAGRHTSNP